MFLFVFNNILQRNNEVSEQKKPTQVIELIPPICIL